MRASAIGAMTAAMVALAASTAGSASGDPAPAATRPGQPAAHAQAQAPPRAGRLERRPAAVRHYVELNSATTDELMTLPGIGAAEARRIIANRPYLTKAELVTKHVLPVGPFLSVKYLVVAMPKTLAKGGK